MLPPTASALLLAYVAVIRPMRVVLANFAAANRFMGWPDGFLHTPMTDAIFMDRNGRALAYSRFAVVFQRTMERMTGMNGLGLNAWRHLGTAWAETVDDDVAQVVVRELQAHVVLHQGHSIATTTNVYSRHQQVVAAGGQHVINIRSLQKQVTAAAIAIGDTGAGDSRFTFDGVRVAAAAATSAAARLGPTCDDDEAAGRSMAPVSLATASPPTRPACIGGHAGCDTRSQATSVCHPFPRGTAQHPMRRNS
jgi:hypothetical protein